MKIRPIILISILLMGYGINLSWADTQNDKNDKVIANAKAWLTLIDNGNYSDSWKEASAYFKAAVSEKKWGIALQSVRQALGKLGKRDIVNSQKSNSLPGAPDGEYIVMSFKTVFEHKKSAVETVTFMLDKDGQWRAAGYFIK